MTQLLRFAEAASLQDLGTFVKRGRRINEQGIRLQAVGTVLAAWLPVMTPGSLNSTIPAVLGLRTMALAESSHADVTVELGSISERLARLNPASMELPLPPASINAPWTAVTPPRSGWEPRGRLSDATLRKTAEDGIAEVADVVPETAGAHVVEQVRERVWGRAVEPAPSDDVVAGTPIPAGAAFGAFSLGFLSAQGGVSDVYSLGKWLRISCTGGFILCRVS
ncbi:hypothetical protein [Garicola koreensis]|uniref:Uncharacterized protein n=1 Tax=Garicola koreensis TaxID=1262554 RepID=A0A7W5XJZ1_9MICC|nr:hypothetical protein [Garicola koreensis]MBB3666917.1 hypothetical protein [Garicola koreensis]